MPGYVGFIILGVVIFVLSLFGKDLGIMKALREAQDVREKEKKQFKKDVDALASACDKSRMSARVKLRALISRQMGSPKKRLP